MTKIDIYKQIKTQDKTKDFRENLMSLFDDMLKKAKITDQNKLAKLARLRAKIDIELKDL